MRKMSRILVTGGCGYVGSKLVPVLLNYGHEVIVVDLQWFGNYLDKSNPCLTIRKEDVGNITAEDLKLVDTVVHLANIANDPGVELNPLLSWETNTLKLTQLMLNCRKAGVKKFLFASSGSVYGVSALDKVNEAAHLEPISAYNKTKMVAERIVQSFSNDMQVFNLRPGTVCGLSPRMRFDVVVNLFVLQAFREKEITVLGGNQNRPHVHIDDMVSAYNFFLMRDNLESGEYNVGFENYSIGEIAGVISSKFPVNIKFMESNDARSYRLDSSKLLSAGFEPTKGVNQAINEIWYALESHEVVDRLEWHTVKKMRQLSL